MKKILLFLGICLVGYYVFLFIAISWINYFSNPQ